MNTTASARLRHDLRTPMNHIIGYTEMLIEETAEADTAALAPGLNQIHADALRVLNRINDFLDVEVAAPAKLDLGRLRREVEGPLAAIAEGVAALRTRSMQVPGSNGLEDLGRIDAAVLELQAMLAVGSSRLDAAPVAPDPQEQPSVAHRPLREIGVIMVVDDDASDRELLRRRLTRAGHEVVLAASGGEALARLHERPIDLLLLDMLMPDMSGDDVLRRIKADGSLQTLPVLVISALGETDRIAHCIELGAEDYLHKPFDPVILHARVRACLEKKRLRDREAQHLHELSEWNHKLEARVAEQVALVERLAKLKRFFSPPLAEAIVAGGADDPLEPHRREVTVCFLDLRGFTAFAETTEPEEVMGVLRQYHADMGRLVMAHEGTLERFTGDGMMVFFNDPVRVPDAGERAVRMSLAMREQVSELVQQWRRLGYDLDLAIGIAQGYATIGAIGFEGRWDYGAIGSVTNLAARLCGEAGPGQILVTQRVATTTEKMARTESVGELPLKGFQRPVRVYALVGLLLGDGGQ